MGILKKLSAFLSGASAQEASGKTDALKTALPVESPVDLSKPVTNPRLVAAIEKHEHIASGDTAEELFRELGKSFLLIGAILDKPAARTSDTQVLFKKGDQIGFIQVRDSNDQKLLALFTDHVELEHFTDQANATFVMPAVQAMNFVLENGYEGLVVNPASNTATLRLDAAFIETILPGM